jgi:hypothetical protein
VSLKIKTIMNISKQEALQKVKELQNYIESLDKKPTIDDINSIQDAENILSGLSFHTPYKECQFVRPRDWVSYQLETIIKATNYIDNGYSECILDWSDSNEYKYYPYFEKKSTGWVLHSVLGYSWPCASVSLGLYFKNRSICDVIVKRFSHLYIQLLNN